MFSDYFALPILDYLSNFLCWILDRRSLARFVIRGTDSSRHLVYPGGVLDLSLVSGFALRMSQFILGNSWRIQCDAFKSSLTIRGSTNTITKVLSLSMQEHFVVSCNDIIYPCTDLVGHELAVT